MNAQKKEETGWLVENGQLCLGSRCGSFVWVAFTDNDAIRFPSKQVADEQIRMLQTKYAFYRGKLVANEHMWCAPAANEEYERMLYSLGMIAADAGSALFHKSTTERGLLLLQLLNENGFKVVKNTVSEPAVELYGPKPTGNVE